MSTAIEQGRPITILYAEDNDDDVQITRLGFKHAHLAIDLQVVNDGEECMAYLRRQGRYTESVRPDLLLLDINMPRMNGFEVLKAIEADESLCSIPVVVLTSSQSDEDIMAMYKLRCSSYISKPVDFDKFVKIIQTMTEYWFTVVALPAVQQT